MCGHNFDVPLSGTVAHSFISSFADTSNENEHTYSLRVLVFLIF